MGKKGMQCISAGPLEVGFTGSQEASPHFGGQYIHTVLDVAAPIALSLHLLIEPPERRKPTEGRKT